VGVAPALSTLNQEAIPSAWALVSSGVADAISRVPRTCSPVIGRSPVPTAPKQEARKPIGALTASYQIVIVHGSSGGTPLKQRSKPALSKEYSNASQYASSTPMPAGRVHEVNRVVVPGGPNTLTVLPDGKLVGGVVFWKVMVVNEWQFSKALFPNVVKPEENTKLFINPQSQNAAPSMVVALDTSA